MSVLRFDPKRPDEIIPGCFVDFAARLLENETISSGTVTSSVAGTVESVDWSGTIISWTAKGGSVGDNILFTIEVVGSLGSVREVTIHMAVRDL